MAEYGIITQGENLKSYLESGQKEMETKKNIAYLNSLGSITNLALVFIGGTAFPLVSISAATLSLVSIITGERGRKKIAGILQLGNKRLKEVLVQKILEKYDQENKGK
jgi:hypothetical protein